MSWFFKKRWYSYLIILIFVFLISYLLLIPPKIIGDIINLVDKNLVTKEAVFKLVILDAIVVLLIYICAIFRRILTTNLDLKLNFELRKKFLKKLLDEDEIFFEEHPVGDLIARATGDINFVQRVTVDTILSLTTQIITISLLIYRITNLNAKLTLYSIIPLPIIWIVIIVLRPLVKRNWRRVREKVSLMNNVILESASNVKTIRSYSLEEENYKKLKSYADDVYLTEKKNLKVNSLFGPLFQSVNMVSIVIALWVGGIHVINGSMSIADLVQFNLYLGMLIGPLADIGNTITTFQQSHVSLDRLNEIYNSNILIKDIEGAKDLKELLSFNFINFNFKYTGSQRNNLTNINLCLKKGETLGIVGKTASGKSTLIKQLVRQYPVKANTLLLNDYPIDRFKVSSIREMISYVPQEHTLFSRSVLDNIKLGSVKEKTMDEIIEAIKKADFLKDMPYLSEGLNTIVGEYGVTLSGGQKQRLSIARAFLKDAEILILDDSLSAVDGNTETNILETIAKTRKGKTNVIIAHRLSAVKRADHIIVLDDGKIIEEGTHQELIDQNGWYSAQYREQELNLTEANHEKE